MALNQDVIDANANQSLFTKAAVSLGADPGPTLDQMAEVLNAASYLTPYGPWLAFGGALTGESVFGTSDSGAQQLLYDAITDLSVDIENLSKNMSTQFQKLLDAGEANTARLQLDDAVVYLDQLKDRVIQYHDAIEVKADTTLKIDLLKQYDVNELVTHVNAFELASSPSASSGIIKYVWTVIVNESHGDLKTVMSLGQYIFSLCVFALQAEALILTLQYPENVREPTDQNPMPLNAQQAQDDIGPKIYQVLVGWNDARIQCTDRNMMKLNVQSRVDTEIIPAIKGMNMVEARNELYNELKGSFYWQDWFIVIHDNNRKLNEDYYMWGNTNLWLRWENVDYAQGKCHFAVKWVDNYDPFLSKNSDIFFARDPWKSQTSPLLPITEIEVPPGSMWAMSGSLVTSIDQTYAVAWISRNSNNLEVYVKGRTERYVEQKGPYNTCYIYR